jgi:hypothetical protein
LRIPFFDDNLFIVKFQSPNGGVRDIYLDSLLPLEAAETTHVLDFVRKYDLPFTRESRLEFTIDGRRVVDYYPLESLKMWLSNVKDTVNLLRLIGEARTKEIRQFVRADRYYSIYAEDADKFGVDDEYAMLVAKTLLADKVSYGMMEFPTTNQLVFEDGKFVNQINPRSAMGYIWSVIRDDLVSGQYWHYKQCAYCGAWEDMSKPGLRRSIWTHCNKAECQEKHLKEKNKERAKVYRQRRKEPR